MIERIDDHRVVLCLGPGGVGKTTTAAALAIAWARRGERVVVLTIDPARRLAEVLGFPAGGSNEARPIVVDGPGELWATMLDPAQTFADLVRSEATDTDQADRILANPLFRNMTRSLSGTGEYMAAERLHQLHRDPRFDRVVVDTPPSRHAFDFLDAPSQLVRFVDHRLYRTVFAPRGLARTLSVGARMVVRTLGQLVGAQLVNDVVRFFSDFETMDQGFRRRAEELNRLLAGPETGHVLVTAPRRDPLIESGWIADNLAQRQRHLSVVVVNRAAPTITVDDSRPRSGHLAENLAQFEQLAAGERDLVERLLTDGIGAEGSQAVRWVHERIRPVASLADLELLAADLDQRRR